MVLLFIERVVIGIHTMNAEAPKKRLEATGRACCGGVGVSGAVVRRQGAASGGASVVGANMRLQGAATVGDDGVSGADTRLQVAASGGEGGGRRGCRPLRRVVASTQPGPKGGYDVQRLVVTSA
ncbi:hypothetical protein PF005_g958 [Phytophthora fragariae]|uniref:Uncharacterized protein n=1 Tax=Phytophthora fragariae TaxID=53985 RepID=A0A6A3ZL48_9STRA|nr:hypothetical protein PF005_g958 [Phytophthora fragariae]